MLWTTPSQISSICGSNRPGIAAFDDQLHVVVPQQSNGALVHAIYDGHTWTSKTLTITSSTSVSLAVYQGKLVCAYTDGGRKIQLMTWDPTAASWSTTLSSTMTVASGKGISVAAHKGLLFLTYFGSAQSVTYCTWNGVNPSWSAAADVNAQIDPTMNHTPALASFDDHLYLFFSITSSTEVAFYRYAGPVISGEAFVPIGTVKNATKNNNALGATSFNGQLVLFMVNSSNQNLAFAWSYGDWGALPLANFGASPSGFAATTFGGALEVVTLITSGSNKQLQTAQGLAGGARPLGALPLWSCAGKAYASTSLSPNLFWGAKPFTIEAWINAENLDGTQYIASDVVATPGGDPSGLFALALRDGVPSLWFCGRWIEAPAAPMSAAEWHHVAATFDGKAVALLLDGTIYAFYQFTLDDVITPPSPTGAVLVGAAAAGTGVTGIFSGTISRVAIFTSARSELEVMQDRFTRVEPQESLTALLDFGRATPVDESMRGVTITPVGTSTWLAQTNALRLTGAGGIDCTVPESEVAGDLSFQSGEDMTVAAWVFPDSNPGAPGTILYRSGQYALAINSALGVVAQAGGGATYATANGVIAAMKWNHVALLYSGGTLSVTVNGTAVSLSATTAMPQESSDHTTIGCRPSTSGAFAGSIATVSIWRSALTHRDIVALRAQSPLLLADLAANYAFFTSSIEDASAQNPTPTLLGSGLELALVNESISLTECAAIDIVGVSVSNPFDSDIELEDIVGFTLPEGQMVAGQRSLNSEQAVWLLKLLLTIVLGFAGILGLSVGSKLAGRLQSYLVKYQSRIVKGLNRYFAGSSKWRQYGDDAVSVLLRLASNAPGVAADALVGLIAGAILDMIRGLWDEGVLGNMFEIIGDSLSWWDLANLLLNIAAFFVPGANAAKIASILIQLAVMAQQLIRLALDYPHNKPVAKREVDVQPPGAMRRACLESQLRLVRNAERVVHSAA